MLKRFFIFTSVFIFSLAGAGWFAAGRLAAQGIPTPTATAVGPWRTGVSVTCPNGTFIPANTAIPNPDITPEELCGLHSAGGNKGAAPPNVKISNTGNPMQDAVTNSVNMLIVSNTKNPVVSSFMQGAATSFISSMFANNAEADRQRAVMAEQILKQQQEAERQRRIEAQQRIDAMFARLSAELKLDGVPLNLAMKGLDSSSPGDLQLKAMNSASPDALKMKIDDPSPTAYGLKGLPGIYVGGPAGGDSAGTAASGQNPNLVNGPGTGTTGPGIPTLPGIYLDGVQPSQAPQLAQAAENLSGPERVVSEDTAIHAGENNPAVNAASSDPNVQAFQQSDQDYQKALAANTTSAQELEIAQAHVESDKSALEVAQAQLAAVTPSVEQQHAFDQMQAAAKTDEEAAMIARQNFDSTQVNLSASRDRATQALAQISAGPAVDLRGATSTTVANLKTASPPAVPVVASLPAPKLQPTALHATVAKPIPSEEQLHKRMEGLQESLRRLMEEEKRRGETREEATADVKEAVDDAEGRGVDMLSDLLVTGWDHCAPLAQGGIVGKFERDAEHAEKELQEVYKEASLAKDPSKLGELNEKAEALERTKLWLERSVQQIERYKDRVDELNATKETKEIIEDSNGDLKSSVEGMGKVIGMALDDKKIVSLLQLSECGAVTVKAGASIIDSVYDIFKEGDAAVALRQADENTTQFLQAQGSLNGQIKRTVKQLNCYKLPAPEMVVSCMQGIQ
jgi:hypothetical protein